MTININRRSTGSRDLLNMCHKAIRCWISQFKRRVYLASRFRAAKTWNKQQTSHCPSCSHPVLSGCSGSAPLAQEAGSSLFAGAFPFSCLQQAALWAFLGDCHSLLESAPWKCVCKGTGKCLQTSWFCIIRKKTITHLSNLIQMI